VKFEVTPAFTADWARLSDEERARFRAVVRGRFHPACVRRVADAAAPWPRSLRVRDVEGATGILEMTWSLAGPEGRATFEWVIRDGEARVRWRRIGGHQVFARP
jgi:hypothetical protein